MSSLTEEFARSNARIRRAKVAAVRELVQSGDYDTAYAGIVQEHRPLTDRILDDLDAAHREAELIDRLHVLPSQRPAEQLEDDERFDADFEIGNH